MNTPPWHNQQPPYGMPPASHPMVPGGGYGAPPVPGPPVAPGVGLVPAGFGRRLTARLLDYVLLTVLFAVFFVATTLYLALVGSETEESSRAVAEVWAFLIFFGWGVALFLYDWFSLAAWGRTPGKRIVSIKVVRTDGGPLTQGQSAGRSALFGLPHSILCLGHLFLIIDCLFPLTDDWRNQSLHDKAAKTMVILG